MSILNNFPFDFLIFDSEKKIRWVAIKDQSNLKSYFKHDLIIDEVLPLDSAKLDRLFQEGALFTSEWNQDDQYYKLTFFFMTELSKSGKLYGIFIRPEESTEATPFLGGRDLHSLVFHFYKAYLCEDFDEHMMKAKEILTKFSHSILLPLHKKLNSQQYDNKLLFRGLINFLSLHYYFDSLKHDLKSRKQGYQMVKGDIPVESQGNLFFELLSFLKDEQIDLNDFFNYQGDIFETRSLDEIVHYFCEISESGSIQLPLNEQDELFDWIKNENHHIHQRYPFFHHRLSSIEEDLFLLKAVPKLLLWENINKLFWHFTGT